jgi:hypothetical protein
MPTRALLRLTPWSHGGSLWSHRAHPGAVETHPRAVETHPGAMEAHPEAMELILEPWRLVLVPWRMYFSDKISFSEHFVLSGNTGGTSMKVHPLFVG